MEKMKMIVTKKANPAFKRFQTLPLLANLSPRLGAVKPAAAVKAAKTAGAVDAAASQMLPDSNAGQIQLTV